MVMPMGVVDSVVRMRVRVVEMRVDLCHGAIAETTFEVRCKQARCCTKDNRLTTHLSEYIGWSDPDNQESRTMTA